MTVSSSEKGGIELEVSDDPGAFERLNVSGVPLCITLCKVGGYYLVDPSTEEDACTTKRVSVAYDTAEGKVCGISTSGKGAMQPSALHEILQVAESSSAQLQARLVRYLELEDPSDAEGGMGNFVSKVGFFARHW